jgi:hypothetical protein
VLLSATKKWPAEKGGGFIFNGKDQQGIKKENKSIPLINMVATGGLEPPTPAL